MKMKMKILEDTKIEGNEINQIENNVELYLNDDYETRNESDE